MDAVVSHSEGSIRKGSTSFALASRLFSRNLREDVWQLYAWCRHCDDVIDGQDHGGVSEHLSDEQRRTRLEALRRETLEAMQEGTPDDPAFAAFHRVALKHHLPAAWATEMLDGFAMDVDGRRYDTVEEMLSYCWGVAGVVGAMMAVIMGKSPSLEVLKRAQDLGLAFQITNICRDVREDALNGRVYLPAQVLDAAGVRATPQEVLAAVGDERLYGQVQGLLLLAEDYYRSSRIGLRALPFRGAMAVGVAREIYRHIGRRIARGGPDALKTRARTPKRALPWLVLRGVGVAACSRLERMTPAPPRKALWSRL